MNRYMLKEEVGEGTFGTVYRATMNDSGHEVAIKRVKDKFVDWDGTVGHREFRALLALSQDCSHIVQIYEIIREVDSQLYFVCEFMPDGTLHDFLTRIRQKDDGKNVDPVLIRSILHQILQGLVHIHSQGYMHRDLKPENLLMKGNKCKVADFSLARGVVNTSHHPHDHHKMTSYVSTRWYRAPELLLCAPIYTTAIDVFALGCIMAELHLTGPLFPGSSEVEQVHLILTLLGPMDEANWPEGVSLSRRMGLKAPHSSSSQKMSIKNRLVQDIPNADPVAISFLQSLLELNPKRRPSARDALANDYFDVKTLDPSLLDSEATNLPLPLPDAIANDNININFTKTPPKMATSENSAHSHAPFVSISPSLRVQTHARNNDHVHNSVSRQFDFMDPALETLTPSHHLKATNHSFRNPEVAPFGNGIFGRQLKRRRHDYRPADAFNTG